ncbi:MAG: dihydroneopterin triphosphate diphosphatase [Candidatus Contendobacter sp.]|nr:dihydroneopterin triphosphate diphosphatase [Gammaproteobacteria bacterium]MCC8992865.1 dihydroneopterin triphosphate diphosphatase [Candidatus Contendobacter sp.]
MTPSSPAPLPHPGEGQWKRPASVLVVVYTAADEVLVMRRRQPPDFWQSVTGSLEWSETESLVAAQRELQEETGLSGVDIIACGVTNRFPILPAWQHHYPPEVVENVEQVFQVRLPVRKPITLNPAEHDHYEWLPRELAAARVSSWTNRAAILNLPS